jgi:hypothetical protein
MSKVGGLISLVNVALATIGTFLNMEAILVSMVEQTYFYSPDGIETKRISFSFMDHIKRPFTKLIAVFKKPSKH